MIIHNVDFCENEHSFESYSIAVYDDEYKTNFISFVKN